MSDIQEVVALNLRRLRCERRMTQTALAFRAEVDRSYLCQLESGQYNATVQMLGKLAKALNVPPGALLEPPQDPHRPRASKR